MNTDQLFRTCVRRLFTLPSAVKRSTVDNLGCISATSLAVALFAGFTNIASGSNLIVDGTPVPGVVVDRITFNGSSVSLSLGSQSVGLGVAVEDLPAPAPGEELACDDFPFVEGVVCDDSLGVVSGALVTDVQEVFPGFESSSEFMFSSANARRTMVLDFRVETGVVPSISGYIAARPGGNPVGERCTFEIDGVGKRFLVTFNEAGNAFRQSLCAVDLDRPYYINLVLNSSLAEGETVNVIRTVRYIDVD